MQPPVSVGRTSRPKRTIAIAGAAALASVALISSPGYAEPSISEVEQRLDVLYHEAEAAQERLNTLNVRMHGKQQRLQALRSHLQEQRQRFSQVSNMVATMAAEEAQSVETQLTGTQQLLLSDSAEEYQDTIAAQEALSSTKGEVLTRLSTSARKLHLRQRQVAEEFAEVRANRKQAAKEEATVDDKVAQAEELLANLEAERRARLQEARQVEASRSASRPAPVTDVSGGAAEAVEFAMDQVGDAYVYGAAGPDAWDCSGLTMQAWGAAGVSLPHSSSAQYGSGTPVSTSELQPGDLVFYYQPISHVAMYIGNGQIVQASNPGDPVNVADMYSMPITGAVRPG
jgi:peptidoglycan DL-endopeptidase CwlO